MSILLTTLRIGSSFGESNNLHLKELWESNLKGRFAHVRPDIANSMLHTELINCDQTMKTVTTPSEIHDMKLVIHSCYCLQKYIDAMQFIVEFNSTSSTTGKMTELAEFYVNGVTLKCWAYMKEILGCRLNDIRASELRCIQLYVNPYTECTQQIIPSPFFGSQRLKTSVETLSISDLLTYFFDVNIKQ